MITSPRHLIGAWLTLGLILPLACGSADGSSDARGRAPEVDAEVAGEARGDDDGGGDGLSGADGWTTPDAMATPDGDVGDLPGSLDAARPDATPDGPAPDAAQPDLPGAPDASPREGSDLEGPPDLGEAAALEVFVPACAADKDCADGDPCTVDTCAAGACGHALAADQSPCDDRDPCTAGDTCLVGACVAGAPLDCDDGDPCTTDQCGPGAGCAHWPRTGTPCDDGDPCTEGDQCLAGACQAGAVNACPVCPDGACSAPYESCQDCPADCGACVESCTGGFDDDLDGLTDCADPDCANTAICLPAACLSALPLACGGSTWGNPSFDHLSGYACSASSGGDGEDDIYAVTLPAGKTSISVTLDISDTGGIILDGDDLDVYVLKGACASSACIAAATSSSTTEYVSASGSPGQVFYVVVELYSLGFWGYGDYTISVSCY